jgi:SAM-dependent methyltransferase
LSAGFPDHFSSLAAKYANFRPRYPAELFDFLAQTAPRRDSAWDCACGNGQATLDLARRFRKVIATDASAQQIQEAQRADNIEYRVAPAEVSRLVNASVDLITVAQAMHWFDVEKFYAEVRRVLRPDGLLAVWTYGAHRADDEAINAIMREYHYERIGPYWPPERKFVEDEYATLPFPFRRLESPKFLMRAHWTLDQLLGYYSTWSGTKRYLEATGENPIIRLQNELTELWNPEKNPTLKREIHWSLALHLGLLN